MSAAGWVAIGGIYLILIALILVDLIGKPSMRIRLRERGMRKRDRAISELHSELLGQAETIREEMQRLAKRLRALEVREKVVEARERALEQRQEQRGG